MKNNNSSSLDKERRQKISELYSTLQLILPNLPHKPSREQIVTGAINCIQSLEREIEMLENSKSSPPPPQPTLSRCGSEVEVIVTGDKIMFFGIRLVFRQHLATGVLQVFENYGAEVLAANVSVDSLVDGQNILVVAVTAVVDGGAYVVEMIKRAIINL